MRSLGRELAGSRRCDAGARHDLTGEETQLVSAKQLSFDSATGAQFSQWAGAYSRIERL